MSFEPQNELEHALMQAAKDPAHGPEFYKQLVKSDIFIIQHGQPPPAEEGMITLKAETSIQIMNIEYEGKPHIPVFSSIPRLQVILRGEAAYIGINALEFLKITKGSDLILNPGSDYGKEITAGEASRIIDGSILKPSQPYVAAQDTKVMIGQPKNYPTDLVAALSCFFKTRKEIKRAWLAHFYNPEKDEKPHTLIAVDATGDFEAIANEASVVAQRIEIPDPPIDFMQITGRGGLEDFFLKDSKPFYRRGFLGLW